MSLKQKALGSAKWTALSAIIKGGVQVLQMAILARLLPPADFGLMAIVSAVLAFATIFADMGVGSAIIQRRDVDQVQLSSLYWVNIGASIALMIVLTAIGPLLADFYSDARLTAVLAVAACVFPINATYLQLRFRAEKELQFAKLAWIEMTAAMIGLLVAIVSAKLDLGIYALVTGTLTIAGVTSLLAWLLLADGWRPSWVLDMTAIQPFLRFGYFMIGNAVASTTNTMADIFLGGRLLGAQALGLYSLPRNFSLQVAMLVNPIITRIGFPVMAKVQDQPEQLKAFYLQTISISASLNYPIYTFMMVMAPELVTLLFGREWAASADVMRLLAGWGLIRSTGNPVGALLMAVGKANVQFYWNLWLTLFVPATVFVGSKYGVNGLAAALLLTQIGLFVPSWYFLVHPYCHATLREYTYQAMVPLLISLPASAAAFLAGQFFTTALPRLLVAGFCFAVVYVVLTLRARPVLAAQALTLVRRFVYK
ncbi:MOP flippase family protein [Vogesella indigofera]|uniref:MOP flippase family protein n=1 Tax=Vogesella indigofera TaxID=45465 RepID=UPI00234F07E0|nr:MOP flippase family protein [Vogesella indigofera]MDC7696779.1 MOP flippase family protein [Vogesella indigofera]